MKRTTQAVFFAIVVCCLVPAVQPSAQTKGKSADQCMKLVPGDWGPNFGDEWHEHESIYWGCRLAVSTGAVKSWQDPDGMIQDIRLAAINKQEFAFVEHLEGTANCYNFAVFRKTDDRWEQVWEQISPDYCMGPCPQIKMTVVGSNLILRVPSSTEADCKDFHLREEYRWDGKTFQGVNSSK